MNRLTLTMLLIFLGVAAYGQELRVQYLEGLVEVQRGAAWYQVAAGDAIAGGSLVRLDDGAFAELSGGGTTLRLARRGTYDLGKLGYVNPDLNALGYDESFARLFNGSSAMYPLGTWFKTEVIPGSAPDPEKANFDFFTLPAMTGGKGDQTSYMGLNVGFVVNAKTTQPALAQEFLKLMASQKYRTRFASLGEFPAIKDTLDTSNAYAQRVAQMIRETKVVVAPPDTGYDLEMAAALYQAIAKVLVNDMTPQQALAEVDQKVDHLR